LLAGLGIVLVAFFMIAYGCRAYGSFRLTLYAGLTLAIFKLIPITLSLPGIAGYILSIGMAVDANVLSLNACVSLGQVSCRRKYCGFKRA
jgi:preprotein translocase subunit SecD